MDDAPHLFVHSILLHMDVGSEYTHNKDARHVNVRLQPMRQSIAFIILDQLSQYHIAI